MKRLLVLVLSVFALTSLVGCGGESSETKVFEEGDVIRIGMECAYAPFNWTVAASNSFTLPIKNASGNADGYDVQMAKYIGEELGCTVEIYALEWDSLILELKMGEIDLIIAGMSPTEERKEEVDFSEAYYTAQHVVLTKQDSSYASATLLSDFSGAKAVAQVNTVYNDLVDQLTGATKLTALTSVNDCVNQIKNNVADVSVVELPVAQAIVAANPELTYVTLTEAFVLADEDKYVSIAMQKGSTAMVEQINNVLATLTEASRTDMMNAAVGRQSA